MHVEEVSTILPSLVSISDSALDIGATIESSPTMVTSSGSTESCVVKTQFDPVIPKSEALPDVILNEEVAATPGSTAESRDEFLRLHQSKLRFHRLRFQIQLFLKQRNLQQLQ